MVVEQTLNVLLLGGSLPGARKGLRAEQRSTHHQEGLYQMGLVYALS